LDLVEGMVSEEDCGPGEEEAAEGEGGEVKHGERSSGVEAFKEGAEAEAEVGVVKSIAAEKTEEDESGREQDHSEGYC